MKKIKSCLSLVLAFSLSFSNLVPAFASGEELTKNEEKRESAYSDVNEKDTASKEQLDTVNKLIGNGIDNDVNEDNEDIEKVTDSIEKINESTDNEESGNDISENLEENNNLEESSEVINSSEVDKDIDEETTSEINKKNKAKVMTTNDDPVSYPIKGTIGNATWEISDKDTARIYGGEMPVRPKEYNANGTVNKAINPDEYKVLIKEFYGTLTIEDSVTFPEDSSYLFEKYRASQINIQCNISNVIDMSRMFAHCYYLKDLDLSKLDATNLEKMSAICIENPNLKKVNLGNLKTNSKLKSMDEMFESCFELQTVIFGEKFNTSQVTDMNRMFFNYRKLDELNLSNFDTSNVTNMGLMFASCENLTELNVSNFNTENVTNMLDMFYWCLELTKIKGIENFNTDNVTYMLEMFGECRKLKELDLSSFDTSNVTNMVNMFSACESLETLNLGGNFTVKDDAEHSETEGYINGMLSTGGQLKTLVLGEKIEKLTISELPDIDGDPEIYTGAWINIYDDPNYNVFKTSEELTEEYNGKSPNHAGTYIWQKWGSTIIFDPNGGEGDLEIRTIKENNEEALSNDFSKSGYEFDHWTTKADGSGTIYEGNEPFKGKRLETFKLFAQWNPNNYTVKFDENGGTGSMDPQSFIYDKSQNLSDNSYTKKGYTFTGWKDDNGTFYEKGEEVVNLTSEKDGIVTLYAQWEEKTEPSVEEYTITFDSNGGKGTMEKQIIKDGDSDKLKKNEFTKEGYHFDHWNTKANDTGDSYADMSDFSKTDKEDVTLYAQWKVNSEPSVEEYTITFDSNGGKGTMEKQIIKDGDSDKLKKNEFTKEGYHFDHWNTKANDTGDSYADMSNFSKTDKEDVTLYAQWEKDKIKDPDVKPNPNSNSKPDKEKPTDEKKDKKNKSGNKKASKNPKTGILASSGLALLLAASGAYISSKRK